MFLNSILSTVTVGFFGSPTHPQLKTIYINPIAINNEEILFIVSPHRKWLWLNFIIFNMTIIYI